MIGLTIGFIWWQDRRNLVAIENLSTQGFSGEMNFPGGRREPVELPPGKNLEWEFAAIEEGHIELRGKMGDALIRVRGAKVTEGQTRVRAKFRLAPDGTVQCSSP